MINEGSVADTAWPQPPVHHDVAERLPSNAAVHSGSVPTEDGLDAIAISVVTVTYARDAIVPASIAQTRHLIGDRTDVEFILVDNNPDDIDRSPMIEGMARARILKLGVNKGVSARNDGSRVARGELIVFIDDDALLYPTDALARFQSIFAQNPKLAIASSRHIDVASRETPRASFPHTNKSLPKDKPFKTFRFQGNGFAMRRTAYQTVGPMSDDFFYGLEEIDYAYRVVQAGFELSYEPSVWVIEHNDPGGRQTRRAVEEMRLTNKMIISWKFMPSAFLPFNMVMFSAYVFLLNRGRINFLRSFGDFCKWAHRNPGRRTPIDRSAQAYIRACGGHVWK